MHGPDPALSLMSMGALERRIWARYFPALPALGFNIKLQRSQSVEFFSSQAVTEDSHSSGTLFNMWMICLFNLSLFIVYKLDLYMYNNVIFFQKILTISPTQRKRRESLYLFQNNTSRIFYGRLIIAIVSLFHPVLMHFPQFYTVLAQPDGSYYYSCSLSQCS